MVAEKGKKAKADSELDDSSELVLAVEKLQEIQEELDKINEEESDRVLEVEQKYNQIRRPVYLKRDEVIQTIPDFWLTAFLCHPMLGDLLNEDDNKVFKYLHSIDVEDLKDVKSGYSVSFNFKPNPFFENARLTKTFTYGDDAVAQITCTSIKWKEGQDISNGKKPEKKGKKRSSSDDSFFRWFNSSQKESLSEDSCDEIAEIIKDDLWPNPLKYFNNEGDEEDTDADGKCDGDGEGEDVEEIGSEEEDDAEEDMEEEGEGEEDEE